MNRLHLTLPETIVPLKTAVRLLRIVLSFKVVPILLLLCALALRGNVRVWALSLTFAAPTLLVWLLLLVPGLDRRLGRYYLPTALALIITRTLR